MTSVQEQLKLKRLPIDSWSVKEQLCLASAVLRSGDQNWMSVSRSLKPFGEPNRPPDWFSQKSCALQYGNLLENVETPKRKKRTDKSGNEHIETPGEAIVRNLTHERINELKRLLQDERSTYLRLKEEVIYVKAGHSDDRLGEMCQQIEEEKKQKEKESEAHVQWLRDRQEKKLELERALKPPASSSLRKKLQRRMSGNRRNSSQSEPSSEAESAVDSPLSEQLNVDVIGDEANEVPVVEAKPVAPTPTSPLLTSLLKSPSPAPSAQSSILHSAITSAHHRPSTSSPTIASLLNSSPSIPPPTTVSPSLKNLVTSAIGAAANEESPKPVSSSPAAGAPTLSMLLELPPSLPGKPLPELPQPFPSTTTTTKPGEVCHPQHQEMRVRSEPGTDEPVEVVEVEQQVTHEVKVEEVEMKVPTESSQVTPSARAATPRPNHRINRKLFAEVEPTKSEEPAAEVAEEAEVKTEEKPEAEVIKDDKQKGKEESPQKSEEQETEVKKEEDEPESKKQENGLAEEDIKMIMDMPVVMGSEIQEAVATEQTVTEVIEVPAAPAGDLDIFIMDSTSVGNQEEVPVVTDIKLDDDDDDNEEEEEDEEQNDAKGNEVETKKKTKAEIAEEKPSNVSEGKSAESTVAVANQVSKQENNFDVGESSRIEVVAIEIPSSELESKDADKDISFEDLEKDLYKEEVKKEDENDEKETNQQKKSDENIDEKAGQEAPEEKTNEEENVDAKEKDNAIQEEVKEKTEIVKDIDVKKEIKDEQEEKDPQEKTSDKEEKTSKVETDTESIEDSSKEEQQAKNVTEESVNDVPKIKESKKQEEEKKASNEESGEEDEAEGHEDDIQTTATKEEDKTAEVETTVEQPSEAPGASNKNWKAEEEEEEDEEKKEAEKSESEEVKTSAEKQKPASTSLRAETPSTEDDKTNDAVEPARTGTSRKRGTTSTPIDSIPNSPAAPLTDEDREYRTWKKAIMLLYGRLATHKYASLFLRPITDDQAPGYSSIVHRPIDLLTIKKNIETGITRTTAEFQRDVMLMFLNSIMYNKSSYHVHAMAREMQREGMQHIQDFLTTQMLVQVSEAPLRRETRTTEAHKRGAGPSSSSAVVVAGAGGGGGGGGGEHLSTPGSSSQEETEASMSTPGNKRKRPDPDRNSTSKKRRGADSSRRHQHTEGDTSKQQTIDKYYKKL